MNVLVVYHSADFDGLFSAAVARMYFSKDVDNVTETLGWRHGDQTPDLSYLEKFDKIIITDISFPPDMMKALDGFGGKVVWIDHHDSSIRDSKEHGYENLPGIRVDGIAACELTWKYFYPEVKCPQIIQYVGAYDVWNKERFSWEDEVLPIQYGLRGEINLNLNSLSKKFRNLLVDPKFIQYLMVSGKTVLKSLKKIWKGNINAYGIPVTVADKFSGIALLTPNFGSQQFESVREKYDLYIVVSPVPKENGHFTLSMYKESDRLPEFNISEYLTKTFGNGGGHVSAARTTINLEQFLELILGYKI